ncbi:MAG: DUF2971 domain-containing protein, partial [Firmicutes bacterium]|nr:DUF2971 domain-containing protein [Bacillota bacterium]
ESIPMWYIYTRGKSGCTNCNIGVRISVENNDFFTGKVYFDPEKKDSYRNISESDGIFCGKTIYDDNKDTSPTQGNMNSYTSSGLSVGLTSVPKLGLEGKTTAWSYEKEARFFTLDTGIHADKIFIGLENSFFDSLKITISPLQTDEQVENAEKEIEKLLGKDRCEPSKLKGTLRFD